MSDPQFLLRSWGASLESVVALRAPDTYESPSGHVGCWWFETREGREVFIEQMDGIINAIRDRVDPGADPHGEMIDTRTLTVAVVTLRLPSGEQGTFRMPFGYGYPAHSARFMFEDGNYSCDCNRRDFLADHCGLNDGIAERTCGDTIQLVSLTVEHEPFEIRQKAVEI